MSMGGRNKTCHFCSCVPGIPQNNYFKKMCPKTQERIKLCVSVYGGEIGIYLRKNLEGAELDLHFDVKIGLVLCFLLPQVL